MNKNSFLSNLKWIYTVSSRFSRVDRKSKSAATSKLASLGICFGVMTLIVVMSVMNGFQLSFIDAIIDLSSYHIQAENLEQNDVDSINDLCRNTKDFLCISPFLEAQTLMTSEYGRESGAVIRAIDPECYETDKGFRDQLIMKNGYFDLEEENSIILGNKLARNLGARVGDTVNFFVLSGSSDVSLLSSERKFIVTGVFTSGYSELNSTYCYINIRDGKKYFGEKVKPVYGIKISDKDDDAAKITFLKKIFPNGKFKSWREYNKSFFGALRIEKNILLLLVALIFVVVGINIYNGMRRLVFERRNEIAIFSALGATNSNIKSIFIMRGLTTGLIGSVAGVIFGLLISVNTDFFFTAVSFVMYWLQYAFTAITSPEVLSSLSENSTYALYATIPARVFFKEVVMISLFGLASPLFASWFASKNILKLTVAEVLHDE